MATHKPSHCPESDKFPEEGWEKHDTFGSDDKFSKLAFEWIESHPNQGIWCAFGEIAQEVR